MKYPDLVEQIAKKTSRSMFDACEPEEPIAKTLAANSDDMPISQAVAQTQSMSCIASAGQRTYPSLPGK
jgi:hypothetical protein